MATPRTFYPQCRVILQVVLDGFGPTARDTPPLIVPCLPKAATIHRNSYKQADSWSLTFEAGDLPFDPALLRAGAVEIYLFQVDDASQRQAVVSRKDPLADPNLSGSRPRGGIDTLGLEQGLQSSKDRFTFGNKPQIAGLFDSGDLEMSDDGKWVEISGQDYTAHLSSLQWPPTARGLARRIPVGQRIDDLMRDLITEADPLGRLTLNVRGIEDADLPIVGKDEVRSNKRGIPVEQDTSYWDVIYKVATRHGLIAFVDGLDVVLSRPKTITDRDQSAIRRMAWGHNLTSLKMSRELGKEQSPTIIVKGYDPVARKAITVTFPEGTVRDNVQTIAKGGKAGGFKSNVKQTTKKSKSGKVKTTIRERDEYQIIPAYGISDRAVLRKMAENLYHLLGKPERKVTARTRDLRDMRDSDLLNLTAGDAVTIEWDEFNRELLADPRKSEEQKVDHLLSRGFNRAIALQVARAYERLDALKRPLRVREVSYEYSADDGIAIEMLLIDFVVIDGIRGDTGAQPTPRAEKRQDRIGKFGTPIGWSQEQEQQQIRRFTQR
jgi:hypothetical protein